MRLPKLDTRPNRYRKNRYICDHVYPELTAVCPVTRLPDFYAVTLTYEPDRKLIELKSLKLYFGAFRNIEILHEEITNKILDDFVAAVQPRWVTIDTKVSVRGGISTTITRKWSKERGDEMSSSLAGGKLS
jgi:7-cyano-7-deazaguanine reductase